MRVSAYDKDQLERELGVPSGQCRCRSYCSCGLSLRISSGKGGNRDKVRAWLLSQGFPSTWVQSARISTLSKAYNRPSYFRWLDNNRDKLGADDSAVPSEHDDEETAPVPQEAPPPAPVPIPAPQPPAQPQTASAVEAAIQALIQASTPVLDEARVLDLIREHSARPEVKHVIITDTLGEVRDVGLQHSCFEKLLRACSARDAAGHHLNIWLSGPAGSGKTTAAKGVAQALGMRFAFNGAIDTEYKLLGFTDAQGRIVSRPFREIYENGGVYLFDEIDRSLPGALLAFNAALANGMADFPDRCVERHPDAIILAAANTYGLGGGADVYVGAMKQDAALLDRFAYIRWPTDEALETATCPDSDWCSYVQGIRRNVERQGLKIIISPRASYIGASLLATGLDRDDVIQMTVRKGMSDEQWEAVQ